MLERRRTLCLALAALALPAAGCSSEADPRPQVVIVVDTDAPLTGQALADPAISGDASVDTLRIDVFDDAGNAYDYRDFVAPSPDDWPISFGVAAPEGGGGGRVNLRIRLFRGGLATSQTLEGVIVLEPRREIAIDRILELDLPAEGVRTDAVLLSFDCLGASPSFVAPRTTCIDAARPDAPAAGGISTPGDGAPPATRAGTSARAREVACAGAAPPGAICIPGGFSILGDAALWGIADGYLEDSLPLRPVIVSPFFLDETEVTVGRLRQLLQDGASVAPLPDLRAPADPLKQFCTFLGPDDPANDALPVNCVTWEASRRICEAAGGSLPTEAQWEHAARGRGQARQYPWGDASPTCCAASASRASVAGVAIECQGSGVEPVGSHPVSDACGGIGDVSRDGLLDLAGSVSEPLLDKIRPYGAPCWGEGGILVDPSCQDDEASSRAARGGSWPSGLGTTLAALRRSDVGKSPADGLRCAYPGSP